MPFIVLSVGSRGRTVCTMAMLHKALGAAITSGPGTHSFGRIAPPLSRCVNFWKGQRVKPDEAIFMIALATAMRQGELPGLRWQGYENAAGEAAGRDPARRVALLPDDPALTRQHGLTISLVDLSL